MGAIIIADTAGARVVARIRETEAYLGREDPASHAYRGRRHAGNQALYGPASSWYVYRSYGLHWCANLVTGEPELGSAVLLRGVEVLEGWGIVSARRPGVPRSRVSDGPGKLCQALAIDRGLDGRLMRNSPVLVCPGEVGTSEQVVVTPRIGITKAVDWPLRFLLR